MNDGQGKSPLSDEQVNPFYLKKGNVYETEIKKNKDREDSIRSPCSPGAFYICGRSGGSDEGCRQ